MAISDKNLEGALLALEPTRAKAGAYDDDILRHRDTIKRQLDEGVTVKQIYTVFQGAGMRMSLKTFTKKITELVLKKQTS